MTTLEDAAAAVIAAAEPWLADFAEVEEYGDPEYPRHMTQLDHTNDHHQRTIDLVVALRRAMAEGARAIEDQPAPTPNEGTPVWELVITDMQDRDRVGRERYGTPLQTFNGRDALVDLYQELLDAVVYVRQVIEEDRR